MKILILIAGLAVSSASPHFDLGFHSSDEVQPPWKHGFGTGSGGDEDMFRRPSGSWWGNFDSPWTKQTTEKPRVTFPIYTPWTTSTTTTSTTTAGSDPGSSTSQSINLDLVIESCKQACPVTLEHNPVCGTDNVTYGNMGKLECARMCGVNVQLKRRSRCSTNDNGGSNNGGGSNGGGNNGGGNNGGGNNGGGNNGGGNNGNNNGRNDRAKIQACMRNCPVTSEYNPVCGTDNVTYTNPGRIECAINCGLSVNILRRTACNAPVSREEGIEICMTSCTSPTRYNPVCGTDNRTYENEARLECARNCGRNVEISRRSPCAVPGPDPWTTPTPNREDKNCNGNGNSNGNCNGRNPTTPSPDRKDCNGNGNCNGNGSGGKTMTEIIACMQLCRTTPEVNPVCGTDGVTYSNPSQLLCAQSCGIGVKVRMFAPCLGSPIIPAPTPTTCHTTSAVTPTEVPSCKTKCMVSPELEPVCGTNGKTYMNIESLLCMQRCGVDVQLRKNSACGSSTPPTAATPPVWQNTDRTTQPTVATQATPTPRPDLQTCINKCTNSQVRKPVCGSDGITYANLQSLQCAKNCGKNVSVKSQSACLSGSKDDTTTDNGLGFTIPVDILTAVFPDYRPESTTTTEPTDDSNQSLDLDERFGKVPPNF